MILKLAGGELAGFIDIYPKPQEQKRVSVTLEKIANNGTATSAKNLVTVA